MKLGLPLTALGLLVCTAHAQTPTDLPNPNSAAHDTTSLPLGAMRHRQPSQGTVDQLTQQRLGEARPAERARRQTDEVERLYQKLIGPPPYGAINPGFCWPRARAIGLPMERPLRRIPAPAAMP
jgi:hypothetical protein